MGGGIRGPAGGRRFWLTDGNMAPVSVADEGCFRYNTATGRLEFSENTGPWTTFAPGPGVLVLDDVAALGSYDDSILHDGYPVWVATLRCPWALDSTSTVAPDGITVVAANSGVGNWLRCDPGTVWAWQAAWWIDQAAGDDENVGDAANPLATHDELVRRIGSQLGRGVAAISIAFVGNYVGNVDWNGCSTWNNVALTYQGVRTVLCSGNVTVATPYLPDLPTLGVIGAITAAGLPPGGFSAYVGDAFVMTSGALNGYVGWIEKDLGADSANYHQPIDSATLAQGDPAFGDTFDILRMTILQGYLRAVGLMTVVVNDIYWHGGGGVGDPVIVARDGASVTLNYCSAEDGACYAKGPCSLDLVGCRMDHTVDEVTAYDGSTINVRGSALECRLIAESIATPSGNGGIRLTQNNTSWGNGALTFAGKGNITVVSPGWWGGFDFPGGSVGLIVDRGQCADLDGLFWGVANLGAFGLHCYTPSTIRYGTLPTFGPNSVSDCNVAGLHCDYADLPVVLPIEMTGIVES